MAKWLRRYARSLVELLRNKFDMASALCAYTLGVYNFSQGHRESCVVHHQASWRLAGDARDDPFELIGTKAGNENLCRFFAIFFAEISGFSRIFSDFCKILLKFCEISAKINKILTQICKISEIRMVQKDANLVDFAKINAEKCLNYLPMKKRKKRKNFLQE